jgi:hypothetical protein
MLWLTIFNYIEHIDYIIKWTNSLYLYCPHTRYIYLLFTTLSIGTYTCFSWCPIDRVRNSNQPELTIVSLLCLTMVLYTTLCFDNGLGHRLSLIELIVYIWQLCVTKISCINDTIVNSGWFEFLTLSIGHHEKHDNF